MTAHSLDFFNPNIYYSLFLDSSTTKLPTSCLSKFEELCKLGHLDAIAELSIDKHYIKSKTIFLNGLLLCIQYKNREVFQYLIHLKKYKGIVERHIYDLRQAILEQGQLEFLHDLQHLFFENLKPNRPNIKKDDSRSLNYSLQRLQIYYQTKLRTQNRTAHLKTLKDKIKELYQDQAAFYLMIPLPLEHEAYQALKKNSPLYCQQQIQKAYQKHRLHRLWRLLHPDQDWSIPGENELGKKLEHHQWLVILMWLAASDNLFIPSERSSIQTREQRIKFFLESLSFISHSEELMQHLLQSVVAHPFTQILDDEILFIEHQRFIQSSLISRFKSLDQTSVNHLIDVIKHQKLLYDLEVTH